MGVVVALILQFDAPVAPLSSLCSLAVSHNSADQPGAMQASRHHSQLWYTMVTKQWTAIGRSVTKATHVILGMLGLGAYTIIVLATLDFHPPDFHAFKNFSNFRSFNSDNHNHDNNTN